MSDTISDKAYMAIRERIISGELASGSFLVEQDLADELGVSRTPIKSALRRLEAEGLIQAEGRKRAIVRDFSMEETKEVLEIRALLEGYAAQRAARNITSELLLELERLADEMDDIAEQRKSDKKSLQRFSDLNDQFHQIIIRLADSQRLEELMRPIFQIHILLMQRFRNQIEHNLKRSCWHHREIIEALRAKDESWAMMQMQTHLFAAGSWKPEAEDDLSQE